MRLDAILAAFGRWIAAFFSAREGEARHDAEAIARNKEAAHAAHEAQAGAPVSRDALADDVRAGRDF